MCWNEHVSLNTFLFSVGVLALVAYNNSYTPYKVSVTSPPMYWFTLSFVSMQLVEYFLWRNLRQPYWNTVFSGLGLALLFTQPLSALSAIKAPGPRVKWMLVYTVMFLGLAAYYWTQGQLQFVANQAPSGHLAWQWASIPKQPLLWAVWLFFFFFGLVWAGCPRCALTGFVLLVVSVIGYYKDGSFQSMWCWIANVVMLWAAIQLLILLPMKR